MKLIEVTAFAVRITGLLILLESLSTLSNALLARIEAGDPSFGESMTIALFSSGLVYLLFAVIFLKFPVSIAKKIVPNSSVSQPTVEIGRGEEFSATVMALMGIYILTRAIPDLVHNILMYIQSAHYHLGPMSSSEHIMAGAVTIVEVGIALFIMLKSRGILALLNRLRG